MASQPEISSLKDTLCAQQKLLHKLYNELEAEREASATAASEALNVILRLQGEKAAVKMEAEQYQRLAEEKICHAEESFAIIEDIVYQKEMEVAALDYQVQSYRYKLLSIGYDPGVVEVTFPRNLLQKNDSLSGETSLGRRNSAPVSLKFRKGTIERDYLGPARTDFFPKVDQEQTGVEEINDLASDSDRKADDSAQEDVWGQIKKLDERVKEIAGVNYSSSRNVSRSSSLRSSRLSTGSLSYTSNLQWETRSPSPQLMTVNGCSGLNQASVSRNDINPVKTPTNSLDVDPSSPCILDVFEVPQVDQRCKSSYDKDGKKAANLSPEREKINRPEMIKHYEPDWCKKKMLSMNVDLGYNDSPALQLRTSAQDSQMSLNQLTGTSHGNEIERVMDSKSREEELNLLKEIQEKVNLVYHEIKSQKVKITSKRLELSSYSLTEAMLYFWL